MENKIKDVLDQFLDEKNGEPNANQPNEAKNAILDEREGLIERVDNILITKDGKQLLREQY